MNKRACWKWLALLTVLVFTAATLLMAPRAAGLFTEYWADSATASNPPAQELALAPGAAIGPLSWGTGIVAAFGASCQACLELGYTDYSYCNTTGMARVGWPPGWGNTGNDGDGQPYFYLDCVFPTASQNSAYLVPKNRTEDFGGPGSSDSIHADPSNGELASPDASDKICGLSTVDLKTGNVNHYQEVGPLTFSYNSLDTYSGPLGPGSMLLS